MMNRRHPIDPAVNVPSGLSGRIAVSGRAERKTVSALSQTAGHNRHTISIPGRPGCAVSRHVVHADHRQTNGQDQSPRHRTRQGRCASGWKPGTNADR